MPHVSLTFSLPLAPLAPFYERSVVEVEPTIGKDKFLFLLAGVKLRWWFASVLRCFEAEARRRWVAGWLA